MISLRLQSILDILPTCDSYLDIGCDHGYLSLMIKQKYPQALVGASDVAKGPLDAAKKTFSEACENDIRLYLSNGLTSIDQSYRCLILAGMGGLLVNDILQTSLDYLIDVEYLVIQANRDVYEVRKWLMDHSFVLVREKMILDYKYYTILVAKKGKCFYTNDELMFGPFLLNNKDETFLNYWKLQYNKQISILKGMDESLERYKELLNSTHRIGDMLHQ